MSRVRVPCRCLKQMAQDGLQLQGLLTAVPLSAEERAELLRAVRKAKPAFTPPRPPVPPPQVNTSPLLREIYAKVSWGLWPGTCRERGAGGEVLSPGASAPPRLSWRGRPHPTPCWREGGCCGGPTLHRPRFPRGNAAVGRASGCRRACVPSLRLDS